MCTAACESEKEKNMINARSILLLVSVIVLTLVMLPWAYSENKASDTNRPYAETKRQRDARMQWWREARFGMFVHWGLYSGLAGTWKGKPVGERGGMEWIQQRVAADTWEYAHEAVSLKIEKQPDALVIHVPPQAPDEIVSVVAIEYQQ
jgi:hypothetical protein